MLTACLTAGVAIVGLQASAVERPDDFVVLPFTTSGDMLVDAAHGQVFVTGGAGTDEIAVVEHDGSVTMVPDTTGATKMSITGDDRFVYATLDESDAIVEIDTSTLAVRRLPTGAGSCPSQVAAVGGYVWFVEAPNGCFGWSNIRRLDPVTGVVSDVVRRDSLYMPALRVIPGSTSFVYAETGTTDADLGVYDVADGQLSPVGTGRVDGLLDDDLQLTNSGDHLMLPGIGGSVSFYRTSDLSADGVATTSSRYDWTAVAADDAVVAVAKAGSVEVIDRASDTRVNDIILDPGSAGGSVEGVRLVGDQMFAVTRGSTLRLYQVDRPSVAPPDLTLDAPAEAYVARPLTLSGELRDQGTPIPGATVAVRQEGVERPLGTPKTDAEGRYTLEVVPQQTGTMSLSANYAGDSTIKPTTTSAQVSVVRRSVSLTLAGPASVWPDEQVNLTGSLFDGNDPYAGASLRVDRRCPGAAWETLATVVTDDAGSFAITDAPGSCNSYEYVVTYDGDTQRLAATAARTVQVTWRQPAVDLVAPSEAHVEETINLSGTLTTADGPLADVPVIARVSTPSGWRDLGTLTTDAAGRFDVDDRPALAGAHCYQVTYAGDSRTRAASMQRCVSVTRWASGFVLDGPQTADLDEELLLTGRFVSEGDQTVGGIALDVSRTDTYDGTQALPSVVTGADGGFTIRDTPPNGGDVTYKVAYAGTATRADNWQTITVTVPRASRTLELSTDESTYDYGQTAHVTVSLTTTPTTEAQRTVQVYAHQAEGYRRLIFSGEVPAAGLTLQPVMKSNTEFSAEIGEDGRALAASSSVPVLTRIGLTTTAKYWYDTVRGYKIYHPRRNPSFVVAARPKNGFGGCVHMRLQRRYASGWRTMFRTECLPLSSVGREAYWTLTGRQATNTPYRVRPTSSGYPVNAPGNGAWVYFKFI